MTEAETKTVATLLFGDDQRRRVTDVAAQIGFRCSHFRSEIDLKFARGGNHLTILLMPLHDDAEASLHVQNLFRMALDPLCVAYFAAGCRVESVVKAMQYGAVSVLPEDFHDEQLLDVLQTSAVIYEQRTQWITQHLAARESLAKLSPRRAEILELLVTGQTNKAISFRLKISEKTVEKHRQSIHLQTGTSTRPAHTK